MVEAWWWTRGESSHSREPRLQHRKAPISPSTPKFPVFLPACSACSAFSASRDHGRELLRGTRGRLGTRGKSKGRKRCTRWQFGAVRCVDSWLRSLDFNTEQHRYHRAHRSSEVLTWRSGVLRVFRVSRVKRSRSGNSLAEHADSAGRKKKKNGVLGGSSVLFGVLDEAREANASAAPPRAASPTAPAHSSRTACTPLNRSTRRLAGQDAPTSATLRDAA
jgi:hypothetical protein